MTAAITNAPTEATGDFFPSAPALLALLAAGDQVGAARMANLLACWINAHALPRASTRSAPDGCVRVRHRLRDAEVSVHVGPSASAPLVSMETSGEACHMTPAQARDLAYALLVASDGAEQMHALMRPSSGVPASNAS